MNKLIASFFKNVGFTFCATLSAIGILALILGSIVMAGYLVIQGIERFLL